ncbi:MAG TPA: secretin N-terminal domain-containing protein [Verrucomicrobiae bacterium]|nr:secretin N-terminal domain-containing protein [Verrucomicrobiae bacterium]
MRLRAGIPTTLVLIALILPLLPVVPASAPTSTAEAATPQSAAAAPGGGATGRAGVGVVPVPAGTPDGLVTRVFTLRYKSVDDAYLLVSPWLTPKGSLRAAPHQKTLTITDTPDGVKQAETLISGFDLPPRVVQVAVQLILASAEKNAIVPTPPPIKGVVDRLNALSTRWSDYKLVGDARVLGTEGERGTLKVGDDYKVDFRIDQIADESRIIRFKPFELARKEAAVEGQERYQPVLNTVLNLRDSQLFIVGASKMEKADKALFMTITASLTLP